MYTAVLYLLYFLAGYTGLTIALYALSPVLPFCSFLARCLAAYISLIICACYGVTASIVLRLCGYGRIAQWATARSFKYVMALTTGVRFEIIDPRNVLNTTRPAVFIGNHQTELDVLMLGCIFPKYCSVTAKSSLKKVPFLGWFMSLSGSVFIDRKNSASAREAMAGAAAVMQQEKQSVYMFPEGTRSYYKEPGLLPFKKGAFHLAVQAKVPIVPVVVANYSDVLFVPDLHFTSGRILVKVLDPIPTDKLTSADVDELAKSTHELMLKELVDLTAKQRGTPIPVPANGDSKATKATGATKEL